MLDRLLVAYTSGLIGAVSPCVLVLVPLMVVRFVRTADTTTAPKDVPHDRTTVSGSSSSSSRASSSSLPSQLLLFLLGFQLSYLLFGFLFAELLTSRVQVGFKLSLGALFLVSSILAFRDRVDPLRLPMVDSPFATGCSFALLLSFNPCTVPFLALLVSLSSPTQLALSLVCFGQGLITPAMLCVCLGQRMLAALEDKAFQMERIKPLMYLLLGASGVYLLIQPVHVIGAGDMALGGIGLLVAVALIHSAAAAAAASRQVSDGAPPFFAPPPTTTRDDSTVVEAHHPHHHARRVVGPSTRRVVVVAAFALLALVFLASSASSFGDEHNDVTHTTVASMMRDAAGSSTVAGRGGGRGEVAVANTGDAAASSASTDSMDPTMEAIHRQAAAALAAARARTTSSPRATLDGAPLSTTNSGLALAAATAASAAAAAAASPKLRTLRRRLVASSLDEAMHVIQEVPGHPDTAEEASHVAGDQLEEIEGDGDRSPDPAGPPLVGVSAADSENGGDDDDQVKCVDLTMVPPCDQCTLLIGLFRLVVFLLAMAAAAYEQIADRIPKGHPATWHGRIARALMRAVFSPASDGASSSSSSSSWKADTLTC